MKTISVVFTRRFLSTSSIKESKLKEYKFLCPYDEVEVGDLIESPNYTTTMQVVSISNCTNATLNDITLKQIVIDKINDVDITEYKTNKTSNKMEKKSIFSKFIEKYKGQFIPVKDDKLKIAMDGNICVSVADEWVGIDKDNNLISYPSEMCMDIPVYILSKPYSQVQIGDIIRHNNTYAKVVKKNSNNSLSCLTYSGYTHNKKEIKDFIFGESFVDVIVNMFNGISTNGFNPMILAMADGNMDMKDWFMMQMFQNSGTNQVNPMNPMFMYAMMDKNEDSSMLEAMMMAQMMGGQMNFSNMFPKNVADTELPVTTKKVNQ